MKKFLTRRSLFHSAGIAAAGQTRAKARAVAALSAGERRDAAMKVRQSCAFVHYSKPIGTNAANGDETALSLSIGAFTKSLPTM